MAKRTTYRLGPDIPKDKTLSDRRGRVIDDEYIAEAVEDAVQKTRGRGRPSLSMSGESPLLRVRIPPELDDAVCRAAAEKGTSKAEWVRQVLDEASRKVG